jgi:putative hemolysin
VSVYCYKCGLKLPDAAILDKKICNGCHTPNSPTIAGKIRERL